MDPQAIRKDFPILDRAMSGKPLVYLDSANTSHKPRAVIEAERDFYELHNANIHRAVYELGEEATALYEGAREKLAAHIGAPDPRCVVFNRGTTESVNLVAHAWGRKFLREGDEIVLTEMEHHSNIVPWQLAANDTGATLRYVSITDEGLLELDAVREAVSDRTRVVAVTGQSNVLGTLPPIREIAEIAHQADAVILVDGAQFVSHNPVDVTELDVDFLTISGHKMLGPTASGGLYAKLELLEEMDPFLGGGEMISEVHPDHSTYKDPPWKFEAGTMNIAQEVGIGAAVDYLQDVGMKNVREHERELTAYALDRLAEAGATIHGPMDPDLRGGAISFWYRDIHPHDLAQVLGSEGVAIRAGHHCAQPLMRRLGVPATNRASFHVYSTTEDVDAMIDALGKAGEVFG
ncbi:MAG TPA: cysteine desulfurase [Actinomycetota bacterium]|nr:cysteine desulfurase [Actinomycetota bacterium]